MEKSTLRQELRRIRRGLADRPARSARIWEFVWSLPEVAAADVIMVFSSIVGEPDTEEFVDRCLTHGKRVVLPEDDPPPDPAIVDVVIVPGLGFTPDGRRLGQGGGWYDRFLSRLRPGALTVGVGFAEQLLDDLPTEAHDVTLSMIVTDAGIASDDARSREGTSIRGC